MQKYILFGFSTDNVCGGINDILFQSDSLKEIFSFMETLHKDSFQILDLEKKEVTVIENKREINNILNYNPSHLKCGDSVWCVEEGLPVGIIVELGDVVKLKTDSGIIETKREKCFKNI